MNPPKKRKIGDESRVFNEEWTHKYFFGNTGNKAVCLLCHETIAVFKEYNLKRHHETKQRIWLQTFRGRTQEKSCRVCYKAEEATNIIYKAINTSG